MDFTSTFEPSAGIKPPRRWRIRKLPIFPKHGQKIRPGIKAKILACRLCRKSFLRVEEYKFHYTVFHKKSISEEVRKGKDSNTDENLMCTKCGISFDDDREDFEAHNEVFHNKSMSEEVRKGKDSNTDKNLTCTECGIYFDDDREDFEAHNDVFHNKLMSEEVRKGKDSNTDKNLTCTECGIYFDDDREDFESHNDVFHNKSMSEAVRKGKNSNTAENLMCTKCGISFDDDREDFECHNDIFHDKSMSEEARRGLYVNIEPKLSCSKCTRRFVTKNSLRDHMLSCHNILIPFSGISNVLSIQEGETKVEVNISEPPHGCTFGQFLVWVMFATKDMLPVHQSKFIHTKFGVYFSSSREFMNWLIVEASGISDYDQRVFVYKLQKGEDVRTREITDPPMGCGIIDIMKWLTLALDGMGRIARMDFIRRKFPAVPNECSLLGFLEWLADVTNGMDDKSQTDYIDNLRAGKVVAIPDRKNIDPPMGCDFHKFKAWIRRIFPQSHENDKARLAFHARKLPGVPNFIRYRTYKGFELWIYSSTKSMNDTDSRAFLDRLRVGPELKLDKWNRKLVMEPIPPIPELPKECSCKEFLEWCRQLSPEVLGAFLKEKILGKPKRFTPLQFLEWAISKTRLMNDEAQREFFNRLFEGPAMEKDIEFMSIEYPEIKINEDYIDPEPCFFRRAVTFDGHMDDAAWKWLNDAVWDTDSSSSTCFTFSL